MLRDVAGEAQAAFATQNVMQNDHIRHAAVSGPEMRRPVITGRRADQGRPGVKRTASACVIPISPGLGAPIESISAHSPGEARGELHVEGHDRAPEDQSVGQHAAGRADSRDLLPFSADRRSTSDRSALGIYLRQIRQYPLLTREEEHEVALKLSHGPDSRLTARLVNANLRLVVKIAREYRRIHNNLVDLIQEGNVGLIHAVRKYDPNRGVRVCSYAAWWIRAYILKFILSNWRLVKVGTTQMQRRLFFNLRKTRHKLDVQGAEVDTKTLAAALYVSEKDVVDMERRLNSSDLSLDVPARSDDQGDRVRSPVLQASAGSRPDLEFENREFADAINDKVFCFGTALHDRERLIFRARIVSEDPVTLVELAERFRVTRERVRQIEMRSKCNLHTYLRRELGEGVGHWPMLVKSTLSTRAGAATSR